MAHQIEKLVAQRIVSALVFIALVIRSSYEVYITDHKSSDYRPILQVSLCPATAT